MFLLREMIAISWSRCKWLKFNNISWLSLFATCLLFHTLSATWSWLFFFYNLLAQHSRSTVSDCRRSRVFQIKLLSLVQCNYAFSCQTLLVSLSSRERCRPWWFIQHSFSLSAWSNSKLLTRVFHSPASGDLPRKSSDLISRKASCENSWNY